MSEVPLYLEIEEPDIAVHAPDWGHSFLTAVAGQ